ncbi:MAG: helix-turn-helix transcriptional regulator [Clostridia bacterium]|nr:helix-turn-helix transcriptional regulator [Clostridia bacterium]MBR0326613.1 helix-turn-helix transcriptional regulator [Clostridia bacterium]
MENLKLIIAKNITELRRAASMTQLDLAQKLNYSDKAVSKWERAESVPDISVLKSVAELFGVTVDYLITDHDDSVKAVNDGKSEKAKLPRADITRIIFLCMSVLLVWLAGTVAFVALNAVGYAKDWLSFIYCIPATFIVWLILNSCWFKGRFNFIIISALMWTLLTSLHVTLLTVGINFWLFYILGIPSQGIIIVLAALAWKIKKDRVEAEKVESAQVTEAA